MAGQKSFFILSTYDWNLTSVTDKEIRNVDDTKSEFQEIFKIE